MLQSETGKIYIKNKEGIADFIEANLKELGGDAYGVDYVAEKLWEWHENELKNFRLGAVSSRHLWLQKDDLEFAIALQEENRLEAVKWLCEKARGHSLTPLKDAKDILDAHR